MAKKRETELDDLAELAAEEDALQFEIDESELPPSDIVAFNELRSCADLFRMHESKQLTIQPDFQRDIVWTNPDQTRFIDSLVKELPIPSMCISFDHGTGERLVIDGLQRMATILKFLGKEPWKLSSVPELICLRLPFAPSKLLKPYEKSRFPRCVPSMFLSLGVEVPYPNSDQGSQMNAEKEIPAICHCVDRVLESIGKSRSCIDGAALLTKSFHLMGYGEAYPLTVDVRIDNHAFIRWVREHGEPDDDASAKACDDSGAFTICIGKGAEGLDDGWPGHLTVVVPNLFGDQHLLIDPTLKQADRPEYQIVLRLISCRVLDEFVQGLVPFQIDDMNGCTVVYVAYPGEHTYGNWEQILMKPWISKGASEIAAAVRSLK